jgi:hypothetical protein
MNAAADVVERYAGALRDYIRAGLVLVPIPAGLKGPRVKGWNLRARCWTECGQIPDTYSGNVGLAHAYAGTCALDIDNAALAGPALSGFGIDLAALLASTDAVHIRSGRAGRDKLLYRLRDPLASINRSETEGFELRCAASNGRTVQDVLPPSIHPDTGKPYQWQGDWRNIPDIPGDLLALWHRLLDNTPSTSSRSPRKRGELPDRISEGERNSTLLSLAAGLVRRGFDPQAVNDRLQKINAERCEPPLCASEVDGVVWQAVGYGSSGWAPYTHSLHDAMIAADLPNASRLIVMTALRRYDGTSAGIALTHSDCHHINGCKDETTFLNYRKLAVDRGFLLLVKSHRMTQNGTTPNLYAIPAEYLPANPVKHPVSANPVKHPVLHIQTGSGAGVRALGANITRRTRKPKRRPRR